MSSCKANKEYNDWSAIHSLQARTFLLKASCETGCSAIAVYEKITVKEPKKKRVEGYGECFTYLETT